MEDINNNQDQQQNGGTQQPDGQQQNNGGGSGGQTFTQDEVNRMISQRLAQERRNQPNADELAAFREWKKTNAPKSDADKLLEMTGERDNAQSELELSRRENYLLRQGVDPEDVDYYVYKISKEMGDKESFEDAAKKYLKDHKRGPSVRMDTGARLNGAGNKNESNANQTMNGLIRKARG